MKLTYTQILEGNTALSNILNAHEKLPTKLAHAVAVNARNIAPEIKIFEELRTNIFKEYGTHVPAHNDQEEQWTSAGLSPEASKILVDKLQELANIEIEVNIHQVKLEDVGETFLAENLFYLLWMIKED